MTTANDNFQHINCITQTSITINKYGTGLKAINRKSSTSCEFINGGSLTSYTQNSVSLVSANQLVLRRGNTFSSLKLSSYFMGKAMPSDVLQSFRAAENADMAALGLPQIA
jgi:hypothetical protein